MVYFFFYVFFMWEGCRNRFFASTSSNWHVCSWMKSWDRSLLFSQNAKGGAGAKIALERIVSIHLFFCPKYHQIFILGTDGNLYCKPIDFNMYLKSLHGTATLYLKLVTNSRNFQLQPFFCHGDVIRYLLIFLVILIFL